MTPTVFDGAVLDGAGLEVQVDVAMSPTVLGSAGFEFQAVSR